MRKTTSIANSLLNENYENSLLEESTSKFDNALKLAKEILEFDVSDKLEKLFKELKSEDYSAHTVDSMIGDTSSLKNGLRKVIKDISLMAKNINESDSGRDPNFWNKNASKSSNENSEISTNVLLSDLEDKVRDNFVSQDVGRDTWSVYINANGRSKVIYLTVACDSKKGSPAQLMRSESERFRKKMSAVVSFVTDYLKKYDVEVTEPELNLKKYIQNEIDNGDGEFTEYNSAEFSAQYSVSISFSR